LRWRCDINTSRVNVDDILGLLGDGREDWAMRWFVGGMD
jgi:hypothetical protein